MRFSFFVFETQAAEPHAELRPIQTVIAPGDAEEVCYVCAFGLMPGDGL